ncbi:MAG TPA: TetR/AcrR family transcriptional regulator [Caulobacter sp.]|nr:TetR/AcrR family transcriptional regulator [Caulobacter sp.]
MSAAKRPTVKPGRPTVGQAAALSEHIVAIARSHFFANGYGATTMDNIAMEAGISKGTLYRRFKTKPDLFAAFLLDQHQRWNSADPLLNAPPTGDLRKTLISRVEAFAAAGLTEDSVNLSRLIYAESGRFPELAQIHHDSSSVIAVTILATDLATAAGRRHTLGAFMAAATLLEDTISGFVLRLILQGRTETVEPAEVRAWAELAVTTFLDGYAPPTA